MILHQTKTLRGDELKPSARADALARFIYRNTTTISAQVRKKTGTTLPPISDEQWLAITEFAVTKSGDLDGRVSHCFTHHREIPAWLEIMERGAK